MRGRCLTQWMVAAMLVVGIDDAAGQPAMTGIEGLPATTAQVFVEHGQPPERVAGSLVRLGPETLTLLVKDTRRDILLSDIDRIQVAGDSVRNGTISGALILGGWCAIICRQGLDRGSQLTGVVIVNAGLGALLGAGVDAMRHGKTTLYRRPTGP